MGTELLWGTHTHWLSQKLRLQSASTCPDSTVLEVPDFRAHLKVRLVHTLSPFPDEETGTAAQALCSRLHKRPLPHSPALTALLSAKSRAGRSPYKAILTSIYGLNFQKRGSYSCVFHHHCSGYNSKLIIYSQVRSLTLVFKITCRSWKVKWILVMKRRPVRQR